MPPKKAPTQPSKKERLQLAINDYTQAFFAFQHDPKNLKRPNVDRIARSYDVVPSTLGRRVAGKTHSHQEAHVDQQRLSPSEEQALKSWILQVAEWGWPPKVSNVRYMAKEILKDKDDHRELGVSWVQGFLIRHQDLRSRWSQPLDRERTATHDPAKIQRWFQLVESTIQKYDIRQEDTYNMDEKGTALGVGGTSRVICSKHDIQAYQAKDGNRDWASILECISADGRLLKLFLVLKGKVFMKSWFETIEEAECIALSKNGWTNNEIGLEWFTR